MDETAKRIIKEFERQKAKPHMTVQFPCCGSRIEILKPRDQQVYCDRCKKTMYLVWQKTPKIQRQG